MQQRLPISLPRVKFGSPNESSDETDNNEIDDDVPATTPSASDLVDGDPEVPLVRPSPYPIRSMHSLPASTLNGTSRRSTGLL